MCLFVFLPLLLLPLPLLPLQQRARAQHAY
jgi:hypothetical protein